jgi:excisionase family DNA binding protein
MTRPPPGRHPSSGDPEQAAVPADEEATAPVAPVSELEARPAYSISEAAQITGLSRDLLYDQMRQGKLAYLKVGRRRIITRRNLEAFLADGAA